MSASFIRTASLALLALGFGAAAYADTIYVCWDGSGDYRTIQDGIDAAVDGDEVVVCDGTYTGPGNRDLDFNNGLPPSVTRDITVRSENGPDNCIIDCEGLGLAFFLHSGESAAAVVDGFTITNGAGLHGTGPYGGGIWITGIGTRPTITNCTISGSSSQYGGGVHCCFLCEPLIINCTICGNTAESGGGVYCEHDGSPTIINCTISGNSANTGGGVCWRGGNATISNCTISNNSAYQAGGVYRDGTGSATITNCTVVDNSAGIGAGVLCASGNPTFSNCTFSGNSAALAAGGVYCSSGDTNVTLTNCILWGDQPQEIYVSSGTVTTTYCDIQGGWPGEGNIDDDPLFVTGPLGDYYLSQTAAGQPTNSPCVDAGSDTAQNLGLNTRTVRTDQVRDAGIVDMGYHYPIPCAVDLDGDGDTDQSDLGILLADWGCTSGCVGDLDGDDDTDESDLGILLADWGCGA